MSILHDIKERRLGKKNEQMIFDTRSVNSALINQMSMQSKKCLHIISRKLDPMIFGTKVFVATCKKLALAHHTTQIKIIIFEPEIIIKYRHELLRLAAKLESSITLRKCHPSFENYNACMFIADDAGYIYKENGTIYTGIANFNDRKLCKQFLKQFTEMWELATPDPNLRKLHM